MGTTRRAFAWIIASVFLCGCAMTREGQLREKGAEVESRLSAQRDKVLAMPADDGTRRAELDRLTDLRSQLTAANLGITAAQFVPEDKRNAAYDVVEQMYDTIEWNIPIPPGGQSRPLPKEYSGGKLNFR